MPTVIKIDAVKRLFSQNGFEYQVSDRGPVFIYHGDKKFALEFPIRWISPNNPDADYNLAQVRKVLSEMTASAKNEQRIYMFELDKKRMDELFAEAKAYGLFYDEDAKMFICKKTKTSKNAIFVGELDFVIAARLASEDAVKAAKQNKKNPGKSKPVKILTYTEIFDEMKRSSLEKKNGTK